MILWLVEIGGRLLMQQKYFLGKKQVVIAVA